MDLVRTVVHRIDDLEKMHRRTIAEQIVVHRIDDLEISCPLRRFAKGVVHRIDDLEKYSSPGR